MKTKYATLAEASAAALELGFKTQSEYKQGYTDDWLSWSDFLDTKEPEK